MAEQKSNVTSEELIEMMNEAKERNEKLEKMYRKQKMLNDGRELLSNDESK